MDVKLCSKRLQKFTVFHTRARPWARYALEAAVCAARAHAHTRNIKKEKGRKERWESQLAGHIDALPSMRA